MDDSGMLPQVHALYSAGLANVKGFSSESQGFFGHRSVAEVDGLGAAEAVVGTWSGKQDPQAVTPPGQPLPWPVSMGAKPGTPHNAQGQRECQVAWHSLCCVPGMARFQEVRDLCGPR